MSEERAKKIHNHYIFNTTKTLKMIHAKLKEGYSADKRLMVDLINTQIAFVSDAIKVPETNKTETVQSVEEVES